MGPIEIDHSEVLASFEIRRNDLEWDPIELVHLLDRNLIGNELVDPLLCSESRRISSVMLSIEVSTRRGPFSVRTKYDLIVPPLVRLIRCY